MSFIVKGIDLPKESEAVELFVMSDGQTYTKFISNSRVAYMGEAQAIQIPKGHGKLIDADTVDTWGWEKPCEDKLDNAPTILEREE